MVTFSFSMARFEELPKALAGALNKLEHDGLVKVNKSGRFHYEALTPLEAVGHQYPHGHIPNGCDVSIAIPVKHIKTFASACSNAKVHHSLMGNAALAR